MNNTNSLTSSKKNLGFTMIELLVVIAIIGILATTLTPKLRKELAKAKVAKVQHKLGLIRSKLSIDSNFSDEFPDLVNASANLKNQFDVHSTEAFSSKKGSFGETDQIVGSRTNEGGWFYNRTKGEIYANLPNGAYTYDKVYEIWNEEIQDLIDRGIVDENGKYLNNPSFEKDDLNFGNSNWNLFSPNLIDSWQTNTQGYQVEVWKNEMDQIGAKDGKHFIELNSNKSGSLYQDIITVPGTTLVWSVSHRGRIGTDTAALKIGSSDNISEMEETEMESGSGKWSTYTKEYIVPEGQTVTRIYLYSKKTANNDPTVGNLIDNFTVQVK